MEPLDPLAPHPAGEAPAAAVADRAQRPPGLESVAVAEDAPRRRERLEVPVAAAGRGLRGSSSHAAHGVVERFESRRGGRGRAEGGGEEEEERKKSGKS